MTDARLNGIRHLTGSVLAFGALVSAAATNPGCSGGGETTMTTGSGSVASSGGPGSSSSGMGGGGGGTNCTPGPFQGQITPGANGGFTDAFDATPNAAGTAVYFTAVDMDGNPGVFKQDICSPGAATVVYAGSIFEAPFNIAISTDDATLYVTDLSAEEDAADATKDKGVLFSLPAAGGMPTLLVGSVSPRGVTVVQEMGADQIYFTGIDKANQMAGVFKVAAGGGAVTTLAEGPPFSDPSGITVANNGDVYVVDTVGSGTGVGNVILLTEGTAAEYVSDLPVGYPAGIALMKDDSILLVSGLNPASSSDVIFQVTLATKAVTSNTQGGIDAFAESAGLHRAHNADVFAWADTKGTPSGLMGTGTVFVIK